MLDASQQRRAVVWQEKGIEGNQLNPTGRRVDMKVLVNCIEILASESSRESGGGAKKTKFYEDESKVGQLSADMVMVVEDKMRPGFLDEKGPHVLACVVYRASVQFYGLTHRGYTCFFYKLGGSLQIPNNTKAVNQYLDLLEFVARIQIHLEKLATKLFTRSRSSRGTASRPPTVIPASTPKKGTKRKRSAEK